MPLPNPLRHCTLRQGWLIMNNLGLLLSLGGRLQYTTSGSCTIRVFLFIIFSMALTGCSERHRVSVGHLNLSENGSKCQTRFRWSCHYTPEISLIFSDTNGASSFGAHPDWPLGIQLEVIEIDDGHTVLSNRLTRTDMRFIPWGSTTTCLSIPIVQRNEGLLDNHRYKFVLTVFQNAESLGSVHVYLWWDIGDSL
jgi:hypothetical protein